MGRTLCPSHGRSPLAFVCAHVADAVRIGRPVATRRIEVDWNLDIGDGQPVIVEHSVCHACWSLAEQRFGHRELEERDLDTVSDAVTCFRCLSEVDVPSGLPAFRIVVQS
jgi:hypothetical protein